MGVEARTSAGKRKLLCSVFNPIPSTTAAFAPKSLHSLFREHALAAAGFFGLGAFLVHEVDEDVITEVFGGGEEGSALVHLGDAFHEVF